jgi:cytochrome c biogenesis protein CcmG, thiol:disulfide interchange protein DsbE
MKKIGWKALPILLFLVITFFLWRGLSLDPHYLPSVQLGKQVPSFTLPELENPSISFSSQQLRGRVTLLNVWASWCASCVEEQVFLMQLARQGVPIVGLNYKDDTNHAIQWLKQWGNPYKNNANDAQGRVAIDLGVYGAPETFIIDKKGIIRYRHAGIMTQELWEKEMLPVMHELEQQA